MKWVLGFLLVVCMAGTANAQSSSTVSGNSLVMANFATHLNYVYATNQTSTAGFLMALNATAVPADGPVVPLDCVALAANTTASILTGRAMTPTIPSRATSERCSEKYRSSGRWTGFTRRYAVTYRSLAIARRFTA